MRKFYNKFSIVGEIYQEPNLKADNLKRIKKSYLDFRELMKPTDSIKANDKELLDWWFNTYKPKQSLIPISFITPDKDDFKCIYAYLIFSIWNTFNKPPQQILDESKGKLMHSISSLVPERNIPKKIKISFDLKPNSDIEIFVNKMKEAYGRNQRREKAQAKSHTIRLTDSEYKSVSEIAKKYKLTPKQLISIFVNCLDKELKVDELIERYNHSKALEKVSKSTKLKGAINKSRG